MSISNQADETAVISTNCRIKVDRAIEHLVPSSVWAQKPFKFDPAGFIPESPRIEKKIVEASAQTKSLTSFVQDPTRPMIYIVAGNPDDSKAKYFAAYLVAVHVQRLQVKSNVVWDVLHGGWDNLTLKAEPMSMLVLSNLTDQSSKVKLEKARDLVEKWSTIPRILVCAGEDPISFATRMRIAAHGIAYFWSKNNKMVQEIF